MSSISIHKLFLLLLLNFLILLPNKFLTKYNSLCNYFKYSDYLVKRISQDDIITLLIDRSACKLKGSIFYKEKLTSILTNCRINHCIYKNRMHWTNKHCFTIQLHSCALQPNKRRRGDNSTISSTSSVQSFETQCLSVMHKCRKHIGNSPIIPSNFSDSA